MIIPNIWENKKCSKPPTSYYSYWFELLLLIDLYFLRCFAPKAAMFSQFARSNWDGSSWLFLVPNLWCVDELTLYNLGIAMHKPSPVITIFMGGMFTSGDVFMGWNVAPHLGVPVSDLAMAICGFWQPQHSMVGQQHRAERSMVSRSCPQQ